MIGCVVFPVLQCVSVDIHLETDHNPKPCSIEIVYNFYLVQLEHTVL